MAKKPIERDRLLGYSYIERQGVMGKGKDTKPRHRRTKAEIEAERQQKTQTCDHPKNIDGECGFCNPKQVETAEESKPAPLPVIETPINSNVYPNRRSTQLLDAHGLRVTRPVSKECTLEIPSVHSAFEVWQGAKADRNIVQGNSTSIDFIQKQCRSTDTENDRFSGGSVQLVEDAINGKFDQSPFLAARDQISKTLAELQTLTSLTGKRRKRVVSEYDGDLNFERLYDIAPFDATRTENSGIARTIDVVVDFSFNCMVSAKAISEYGAVCWSVVDLLERSGIQCNVLLEFKAEQGAETKVETDAEKVTIRTQRLLVKRADQYQDPMDLARCFTSWFFRRILFTTSVICTDAQGLGASYGLGGPIPRTSHAKAGELFLGAEISRDQVNIKGLVEFIKTAVTKG